MSTLRVNTLQSTSTTDGGISIDTSGHVTVDGVVMPSSGPLSNRNRIINGDMRIDQRNAGASVSGTTEYPVDRFRVDEITDGVTSCQQVSDAPAGFSYSLKVTTTTADASLGAAQYCRTRHRIEGYQMADFGWGTADAKAVTLSFWVKSSLTGTFGGALSNSAANHNYGIEYAISSANTWEYKTIAIPGDTSGTWLTTNGIGIRLDFGLGVGTDYSTATAGSWTSTSNALTTTTAGLVSVIGTLNATWQITGVQLEVGSVATPFEHRSYGDELARCQRYYSTSYDPGIAPGTGSDQGSIGTRHDSTTTNIGVWAGTNFGHTMRAAPTVTLYSPHDGAVDRVSNRGTNLTVHTANVTVNSIFGAGCKGFAAIVVSPSAGPSITYHYTASAEL